MASYYSNAVSRFIEATEKGADEFGRYYQLVYAMTNNDWATKIGISFNPLKRAEQIGFNIYHPNFRIAMFAISTGWSSAVEDRAHMFAKDIEYRNHWEYMQRSKGVYRYSKDDETFGFRMRSGGTEVYGITYKQAIGAISMARNQVELHEWPKSWRIAMPDAWEQMKPYYEKRIQEMAA